MKRTGTLGGALLVAALVLTGCSGGGAGGSGNGGGEASAVQLDDEGFAFRTAPAKAGGTVRVLSSVNFSHLDPAMGNDGALNNFYRLIYRHLTTYKNADGMGGTELVGDLATDTGTPNADATEWTYTLRDDIFFEDGTPIRAQDFKFGLERSLDPALAIGQDYHQRYIKGASDYEGIYKDPAGLDSIETPDDKTIIFKLNQPLASFPNVAAMNPVTPFPEGKVTTVTQLDEAPISSGPYKIESHQQGSKLVLTRNEHWKADTDEARTALPDSFEFLFGLDPATIDQRLISGQGDDANAMVSNADPLLAASLSRIQTPDIKSRTVKGIPACTTFMTMNTTKEYLSDLRVREALSYAVDKASVLTSSGGESMMQIATDMLPPAVPGKVEVDLFPSEGYAGDVEKAKALLAEAGHPDGFSLTMDVRSIPMWEAQAVSVQQSLAKIGVDLKLNVIDAASFYGVISTPAKQNDLAITGWCSGWLSGIPLLEPMFSGDRIYESGSWNVAQLNDPKINQRFIDIGLMTDLAEQDAAFGELNREIMAHAPVVPLVRATPLFMLGSNIGDGFAHAGMYGYVDYSSVGLKDPEK